MELDQKALDFAKKAKDAGFSYDDVVNVLREKGYSIPQETSQQQDPTQQPTEQVSTAQDPGLIMGGAREFTSRLALGLGPIIAGATNVPVSQLAAIQTAIEEKSLSPLKELDPRQIKQQFESGRQEFIEGQKAFGAAHPVAQKITGTAGDIVGLIGTAGTVGAGAKTLAAGTKLGKAGKLGQYATRAIGEAATFGTYETVREGFAEGEFDAKAALGGGVKGVGVGSLFGVAGGVIGEAEKSLVNIAKNMIQNPMGSKLAQLFIQGAATGTEGLAIGAAPAITELRAPTKEELLTGEAFAVGGRGAAELLSRGGQALRKFAETPTKMQLEEIKSRAEEINKAKQEVETSTAKLQEAEYERQRLQSQLEEPLKTATGEDKKQLQRVLKEAKVNEDWAAATKKQAEEAYDKAISPERVEVIEEIKPIEKDITKYMKDVPGSDRAEAEYVLGKQMARAKAQVSERAKLPLKERMLRSAKNFVEGIRREFNLVRPVTQGEELFTTVKGEKIPYSERPTVTVNRLNNGGQQEALLRPVYETAEKMEKAQKGTLARADLYLQAQKDIQFKRNMGLEPSQRDIDFVNKMKDVPEVQEVVNQVRELNKKSLDSLYESGRIDRATYEKWKQNDNYVPSQYVKTIEEGGDQMIANNAETFLRKYGGEQAAYEDTISQSMGQARWIDQFSELQKAKRQYVKIAQETGQATLEPSEGVFSGGKVTFDRKNQIVTWKDGQPQIWNVPEKVARFFNPEKMPKQNPLIERAAKWVLNLPLRAYKGGTTAISLGFSQANIVRDVQSAVLGSKYGAYIGPDMIMESNRELIENKPIAQEFFKEFGTNTKRDIEQIPSLGEDNVRNFRDLYSSIDKSQPSGTERSAFANLMTIAIPRAARKAGALASKTSRKVLDALSYAGNLGEETTRLSVFKSVLREKAANEAEYRLWLEKPNRIPKDVLAEAGNEAREVTLNFRRQMAPWVEVANRYLLPYFKPSILGAMRGYEVLTNPEIAPRAWRYIINTGMMQGAIAGKIGDKKQLEGLDAINNEIAGKNFLIPMKKGGYLTFPLSQEFAPLIKAVAGATEALYRHATKQQREDIGRELLQAGKDMFQNYMPAAGFFTEPSNWVVGGPIPKTIVEQSINMDLFTGVPIEPEYLKDRPAYMRYTKATPKTFVEASKLLSKFGINYSPNRLKHLAKATGSSSVMEWTQLADSVLNAYGIGELRPKKDVEDNPIIRRFVANLNTPYSQYALDVRYVVRKAKQGDKAYKDDNLSDEQKEKYFEQHILWKAIKNLSSKIDERHKKNKEAEEKLSKIGYAIQQEYKDGKISLDEMKRRQDEVLNAFNERFDVAKEAERQYQLMILQIAKEQKEQFKKNPPRK